jgi:hypothetical protein
MEVGFASKSAIVGSTICSKYSARCPCGSLRGTADPGRKLIPASPIVICSPTLRGGADGADGGKEGDDDGEAKLTACQVKSTTDDFDGLAVPLQPAVVIDAETVRFPIAIGRT